MSAARRLLDRMRADLPRFAPETVDFAPEFFTAAPIAGGPPPAHVPAVDRLGAAPPLASEATRPIVDAVLAAAPDLYWRRSYTAADGVGDAFLNGYGWFELFGPTGAFNGRTCRVMAGFWDQGLVYPDHSHAAEELYVVLAGGAVFSRPDHPPRRAGPGDVVHHPPHAPHAMAMRDAPLLALGVWRGDGFEGPPALTA